MGHRNILCTTQMIGFEMEQQGQSYLQPRPESHIIYGALPNIPPPDLQTMLTAPANTPNVDAHHPLERYDGALFYGMPQYQGMHYHHHHVPNLDLGVPVASNLYLPYISPSAGLPMHHDDHLSLSSSYGGPTDEFGMNNHFFDDVRVSYKRKNAQGNMGYFQYFNLAASSSASVVPFNTRHPDGVTAVEAASFADPQYRGSGVPSIREIGLHRSVRDRSGLIGLDNSLAHSQHQFIQGSYVGQPFQPDVPLWSDQQLSSNSADVSSSVWNQTPAAPFMHGNRINGGTSENGGMILRQYHETAGSRSSTSFLHTPAHLRQRSFHQFPPSVQGTRGQNVNALPHMPPAPHVVPSNFSLQCRINRPEDGLDAGGHGHNGSEQPTGFRAYRLHSEGAVLETSLRSHSFPQLRVLPTDGVAVLEFPNYNELDRNVDHHRDMRLDIEEMSYEELLALGDWIGNVSTGLSDEIIRTQLKTRMYLSSPAYINPEEGACINQEPDSCINQEPDSCIICQDDYRSQEAVGTLNCGHEYHAHCVRKWLRVKNVCPICKSEAVSTGKMDV